METKEFRSPARKLVSFFQHSRDMWKAKCQERKYAAKLLSNQVRAVEKSREQWKEKAKSHEERVRQLEGELSELKSILG